MSKAPFVVDQDTWRRLFKMGDHLLACSSVYDEVSFIKQELKAITGAHIEINLLDRFKPLPVQNAGKKKVEQPSRTLDLFRESFNISAPTLKDCCYWVPLEKESKILGVIKAAYDGEVDLPQESREFLEITGRYLAGILDAARVNALKDWRNEQLALVRDVGFEIVRYRETRKLFDNIVQLIANTFQFYFVALYTFNSKSVKLNLKASTGEKLSTDQTTQLNLKTGIPLGEGLVGHCAATCKEVNSPNVSEDSRYRKIDGLVNARSEICLPLLIKDQLLGVLEIISDEPDAFHSSDVMVLHILADSAALAIENADLFYDLFEKTWLSTVMLQVAEAAQAYDCLDDLFAAIVRILPLLVGVDRCAIYMQGRDASDFYLNAHYGFEKELEPKLAMLPYLDEAAEKFHRAFVLKIPLDIDRALLSGDTEAGDGVTCCELVPMVAHDRVLGFMLVDETGDRRNNVTGQVTDQKDVLMAVARQIALAIENFELNESREYEAYINTVLLQVAEMVSASENLDETLSNIINLLPLVVGVDTALIYICDEKSQRLQLRSANSVSWKTQVNALPASVKQVNGSLDLIAQARKPVIYPLGERPPEGWLQIDYRSVLAEDTALLAPEPMLMVFPLYIAGENFGFLLVSESGQGHEVREKKMEIITGVAQQLSIAIQNERLKQEMVKQDRIRREIQLAQQIQKTFLPEKLPQIPGWDLTVRWRPALQVGGDFYDAIQISDKLYGLVIGDVSDKGLPAALYMTVARTLIHAAAQESNSPQEVLQQVNRLLLENSQEGLFVTTFYAILDVETGEMVYTNAGHNKPILLHKNHNEAIWLEKGGMPLGVDDSLALENKTLQIRPGDHLIMYTDGVTEARSPIDAIFGEDRLYGLLKAYTWQTDLPLIEMLDSKLLEFQANALPSDDVTIYVIQRVSKN